MGKIFSNKDLKKLIVPLILEQALALTVGMADTIMVSSVGDVAVSGVSLVDMLNNLIFSFFSALAAGGAVVVSQFIGAKKENKAIAAAKQLVVIVTLISLVITALTLLFRGGLLTLLFGSIEADVRQACIIYLTISAFSFPFLALYNACTALFRSIGRTDITFKVSIVGNLINVGGNALCVFAFKMGVAGVAVPTLISRAFMAVVLYIMLKKPKWQIYIEKGKFRFDMPIIRKILYIGIPGGIENTIFQLGRVIVVSIISEFGTAQIAANGVANSVDAVGIIAGQAMNLAMITVIGQCVGAGDEEQIKYYTKKLMIVTYIATAALTVSIILLLNPILMLFGIGEEATDIAYKLIFIHCSGSAIMWPMAFTFPNMLRACNDVKFPMVCSILSMWIFRIGFSLIFGVHYGMGAIGVWIAMLMDWVCRIICFVIRYYSGAWKRTMYRMKRGEKEDAEQTLETENSVG